MNTFMRRMINFSACLLLMLGSGSPVLAEDTELFVASANNVANAIQPNILFIIDTSGSMSTQVNTQATYDPNQGYGGGACDTDSAYWVQGGGAVLPDCSSDRYFNKGSYLKCERAQIALAATGAFVGTLASHNDQGNNNQWGDLGTSNQARDFSVECDIDTGIHGKESGDAEKFAADGNKGPWSLNAGDVINWAGMSVYSLYDGNWLNYNASPPTTTKDRMEIVQVVTKNLLDSINGVNVGLMRFSNNHGGDPRETRAEGGMVIFDIEDIATARTRMKAEIDQLDHDGWTSLSETLYEAGLYYGNKTVDFGVDSKGAGNAPQPSIAASREPADQTLYDSPIEFSCQENYIILLTDGEPTQDNNADGKIIGQTNFNTLVAADCDGNGAGRCLDDQAEWMFVTDISSTEAGRQSVKTFTIGFSIDLPILESTAKRGGGVYHVANDTASLTNALTQTVLRILDDNVTFTAPTVSVNAFNRTQNLNDLFITVFQAADRAHWPGNLKKYKLVGGEIVGADGVTPVVDPATGFFLDTAQSFWAAAADGSDVMLGGAANQIPDPANRNLYTYTGGYPVAGGGSALSNGINHVDASNASLTDQMLNIGAAGDPTRQDITDWMRGVDINDVDQDNDTTDNRYQMGDPLHAKPVSVIYGGNLANPDITDAIVFTSTNDGYLHAIDPSTGQELWAWVPQEALFDQKDLYFDAQTPNKKYGLDGDLRTVTIDQNQNGIVEAGDQVMLYMGQRRGGNNLYGLDITDKNNPVLKWRLDSGSVPGLAQTWSTPIPARVVIQGAAQNALNLVLVFGGGYDATQDNFVYTTDVIGNGMYMVDAMSGALLWRAGTDALASLQHAEMDNSFAADIRVLDMNSDGFADRMYASDMGGRVWRFDIFNNQAAANLVNGGVIASLGAADTVNPPLADTRRFYYAPDVAIITQPDNSSFINIGIGSGYRAHPLDTQTADRFYSIRDYDVFDKLSQPQYDAIVAITEADPNFIDISNDLNPMIPVGASGWKMILPNLGEKVLAESRTFNNKIFFTTFEPAAGPQISCEPRQGVNRLYAVNATDATPFADLDGDGELVNLDLDDRVRALQSGGIAPEVVFMFPAPDDPQNCVGLQCTPPPECLVGLETCNVGFLNNPVRTFWNQDGSN